MNYAMKRDISQASHKIALLAILVAGVLFSLLVVSIKSDVRIDDPMELAASGFSAPLPAGENWQTRTGDWIFDEQSNYFYIGAIEKIKGVTSSAVQWRYIVCPEGKNLTEMLEQRGEDLGGYSGRKQTFIGDGFGAYLTNFRRDVGEYVYLALIVLEPGRAAELEVRGKDPYYAEDVFEVLLRGAEFETNGLLNLGRMVRDIARERTLTRNKREPIERLYLLDSNGLLDGFSGIKEKMHNGSEAVKTIMYASIGVYDLYRQNFFKRTTDGRITWKFVQHGSQADMKREVLMTVDLDNMLTVTDFTKKNERKLKLGDTFWPEVMDFEIFGALINSEYDKCVIDMLSKRGEVTPVLLSKERTDGGNWNIKMDYFNTPNYKLTVETDSQGRVVKRLLEADVRHKMELCSREDILARYPQQSSFLQELYE
jgi:hypothetical protein